ncbi:hypothetical protein EYR40_008263 [Pleurotus pulmonarius]|nr:hypothetical protein EYR36_009084 [Pleurotus pulmonarius]KAF4597796.1 hypothetical protein EYR40_008263 [Pleurotus pulmonarius]
MPSDAYRDHTRKKPPIADPALSQPLYSVSDHITRDGLRNSQMSSSRSLQPPADERPLHKRPRLEKTPLNPALSAAKTLLDQLKVLLLDLESNDRFPAAFKSDMRQLRSLITVYLQSEGDLTVHGEALLNLQFPSDQDGRDHVLISCQNAYKDFCVCYSKHRNPKPNPSDYAANWPNAQKLTPYLLCARPTIQRGLPLSTLHDVFREFIIRADSPLPHCSVATHAIRAAHSLCGSMGDAFADKSARSQAFDRCTQELFGHWQSQRHLVPRSEACSAHVDRTLESPARLIFVLREDKTDIGQGGEVYMQVARDYDMYRQDSDAIGGAPAFLVCVQGPILIVSGGFYDGSNTLVEPLTRPCYMLADETGRRQQDLAQVLYALHCGIQSLKTPRASPQPQIYPASTPRVYLDCASTEEVQARVGSLKDFEPSLVVRRLIFSAKLVRPSAEPERVLVKLVTRPYGEKAHKLLARHGYAPQLYGRKVLEGAPTAYVMEHLGLSWVTLYNLSKDDNGGVLRSQVVRDGIKHAIERILSILKEAAVVHGDLRANNIMIKLDGQQPALLSSDGVAVKVIDFDWAGDAGVVRYPAFRNQDIPDIQWPGLPGGLIQAQHDRELFESWWPSFSSL